MRNLKITIQYNGSNYCGWQKQPDSLGIQGTIERAIYDITREEVKLTGSGRTDAGVHALGQVANFKLESAIPVDKIPNALNSKLPKDISVIDCIEVNDKFHSRYNAKGKTYIYSCYIGNNKQVFIRKYIYAPDFIPDVDIMQRAAEYMTGEHDFAGFCTNSSKKKSTVRIIDKIDIKITGSELQFEFHGNGFLYNMVRIMVGTLLKIGKGEMEPEEVNHIFETKKRSDAGPTAPALGLRLEHVDY